MGRRKTNPNQLGLWQGRKSKWALEKAREKIRKAHARLREQGHSEGCACGLCEAIRGMKQALGILYEPGQKKCQGG